MKPQTFFRLALLTPFAFWVVCLLLSLIISEFDTLNKFDLIVVPVMFYTIGIILWFIPYTILAIGLFIWSIKKSVEQLKKAAFISPLIFFVLILTEVLPTYLPADNLNQLLSEAASTTILLGVLSFSFGYFCVGIAFGIYKWLQTRNHMGVFQMS